MRKTSRLPLLTRSTLWWLVLFGSLSLIGMLAAVIIPLTQGLYTGRSAKARTDATMQAVFCAIQAYKVEYGQLPSLANRELIKDLSGRNGRRIPFLSLSKRDLNNAGEVVDSWGTPLRIVLRAEGNVEIISCDGENTSLGEAHPRK